MSMEQQGGAAQHFTFGKTVEVMMQPSSAASILIVEDERLVAKDIQQALVGFGYDAFGIATSGEEAIATVSSRCPDLVLMDIRIKGDRDGVETAAILRERFGVPVVYLTAHADEATIQRAKQTEPHGYLLKPVTAAELRSAIEVSLYKHAMESRLRERERWFSTTLRAIADAVISVDPNGRVTFMNPAAEQLIGCSAQDCLGRTAREVLRLADVCAGELPDTPLDRVLTEGRPVELPEAVLRDAARGEAVFISHSTAPVIDDDDRTIGAVMVFRDITEHKRLRKRLEQADRLAALGTMAAGVAHELGNPLTCISANASYIEAKLESIEQELRQPAQDGAPVVEDHFARVHESVRELAASAKRMQRIVCDIQTFSRPAPAAAAENVADVARALRSAIVSTTPEICDRARLVTQIGDLAPVEAEEARLEQVFVNLLMNAAQSIDTGGIGDNEIRATALVDREGRVVVEIRDSGPGIPPSILGRLFEPFFTTKRRGKGTGLGLSICHGIVTALGGEIMVESELGMGTVFRVVLPAVPGRPTQAPETLA
jgi:two-component system cell cycle sensor histidine kinase/response regulator CckA